MTLEEEARLKILAKTRRLRRGLTHQLDQAAARNHPAEIQQCHPKNLSSVRTKGAIFCRAKSFTTAATESKISDLSPSTATNKKGALPNRFVYTVGADVSIIKRLTGAFDIYGQRLFDASQLFPTTYTDLGKCSDVNCTTLPPGTTHADLGVRTSTDYNITSASLGLKYRLFGHLVMTGNVLLRLDDPGLRAKPVPLVGVSYSR